MVCWFKTMTTNGYINDVEDVGWERFKKRVWQHNFWEHIIRSEKEFQNISNYIVNNPKNWKQDKFNS